MRILWVPSVFGPEACHDRLVAACREKGHAVTVGAVRDGDPLAAALDLAREARNYDVVAGISGGGAMAHLVAGLANLPAALVCPILSPASVPNLERASEFFGPDGADRVDHIWSSASDQTRCVMYGTQDRMAPWKKPPGWHGDVIGIYAGHELCKSVDTDLFEFLLQQI